MVHTKNGHTHLHLERGAYVVGVHIFDHLFSIIKRDLECLGNLINAHLRIAENKISHTEKQQVYARGDKTAAAAMDKEEEEEGDRRRHRY